MLILTYQVVCLFKCLQYKRYWNFQSIVQGDGLSKKLESSFHKTIKKVTEDIEVLKFNTAIASLMALMNDIAETNAITKEELKIFTILLNPFAPHITEEVWEAAGFSGMVAQQEWPKFDEAKCKDENVEIAVQVNGKVRARLNVSVNISKEDALAAAKAEEKVAAEISGKNLIKEIYVPGKLVNIVAK